MRPHLRKLGSPHAGPIVAPLLLILLAASVWVGCEVDRVKFNRLEEAKKFLAAGEPFQAAVYFAESMEREPETKLNAMAYLAVAYDRAMRKVGNIPSERAKYKKKRDEQVEMIRQNPGSIPFLVDILANHDLTSQSAEGVLVDLGADAAEALLYGYRIKPVEQPTILRILEQIGPEIVPRLEDEVRGTEVTGREKVALLRLIGKLGGASAKSFLTATESDTAQPVGVRMEATAQLYQLGEKDKRERLIAGLDESDELAREAAAHAMSSLNGSPGAKILLDHLDDANPKVRAYLVKALAVHKGGKTAIDRLIDVIRTDKSPEVASAAVDALTAYGTDVIDPIMDALRVEPEWTSRQRLVRVLSADNVKVGLDQDRQVKLYEYYEKKEQNAQVKGDIGQLLTSLEGKESS